ncbi:zinc uptake protein ZrgA [Vibrio sp. M260118]|uniref:zinc uptake protein ZrgA n=1 Tax=Vibrio sp. M260118 TaxID=3020896 RepID=UPI002F4268FA
MKNITPIALGITLAISSLAHAEEGYRQHDAHVHGQVEINIAQDGKELLMEITAPGADVVGFEHAPKTDEQKHQLEDAVAKLKQASNVFTLAKGAGCQVEHQSVSHTLGGDEHEKHEGHDHHDHDDHKDHDHHDDHKDHDHDHDDHKGHDHHDDHKDHDHGHDHEGHDHESHEHGGHGEFTVEYHFECSDISKLNNIETQWFSHFPSTELIKVNVLTDTKQTALELHKGDTKIAL